MGAGDRIRALMESGRATTLGLAATAVWLLLVLLFWWLGSSPDAAQGGLARLASVVAVVLPLVLIWTAVGLVQAIATLRAEADDLYERLSQMRGAGREPTSRPAPPPPAAEAPRSVPVAARPAPAAPVRAPATDSRQTALRFETPESEAVATADLIRALDFPDGPDDAEGIAALRQALRDHDAARVLRSAQDVVTLLAAGDIYMDDVTPGPADVALWRRFGDGVRGAGVGGMATVNDDAMMDGVAAMLKGDEIFRDVAHHFLRHFDLALVRWLPRLSDDEIEALARTRSALAFVVIGRVTGIFG
ncbi:hypothetical protein MLD63_00955 (plasmid) [Paracoccus sp. TK19116]|uniref:Uncharacterized protein n=1 Tax=Paracoccus albicereus TaxID=2922394 RepID=A0ABT1MNI0_9RHOB|nr:hypothetical protein [Paracoccus albicereus]MCQ0969003.1 hypothetical protein [Paracoccus albicereus]